MTKPLLPWQKKGYRFSIDWPPGFVPSKPDRVWTGFSKLAKENMERHREKMAAETKAKGEGVFSEKFFSPPKG